MGALRMTLPARLLLQPQFPLPPRATVMRWFAIGPASLVNPVSAGVGLR
jgi:hypothetical protein